MPRWRCTIIFREGQYELKWNQQAKGTQRIRLSGGVITMSARKKLAGVPEVYLKDRYFYIPIHIQSWMPFPKVGPVNLLQVRGPRRGEQVDASTRQQSQGAWSKCDWSWSVHVPEVARMYWVGP